MSNLHKNAVKAKKTGILILPYLVLVIALLVTLSTTYFFYRNSKNKDDIRFATEVSKTQTIIENKLNTYVMMLKSARAYIESNPDIDKKEFAGFIKNLEVGEHYTGIYGLGYVKSISPAERQKLVEQTVSKDHRSFKIFPERPDNKTENLYVIMYLEPSNPENEKMIGFDMASDAGRLKAMNEARDSGQISVSGKLTLMRHITSDGLPGFLMYLPIYKGTDIPQSLEEKKRQLSGFVYSPFQAKEFLNDVQETVASKYLSITVYDGEKSEGNILAATVPDTNSIFSATNEVPIANKKWIIEYNSLPDFEAQSSANLTSLVFIAGLTFSVLLFGLIYVETTARAQSERIAANLRKSENEKVVLLESEQKARETAEKASHAKDEFIANVSHELRTPLNSIAGWSKILQSEKITPAMKQQALQTIDRSLRTQTKIIEDLLDFSQISFGKKEDAQQEFKFSDVFEEAFTEVLFLAEEKKISLNKVNNLNGQKVYGDYPRFKKVVKNLLANAIKFTPKGGKVFAEAYENQEMLELKIADNGQGIAASFLPHIFDRFKQADSSITRQHGGLGMGLAISRQIIEYYGGEIEVKSEGEGKGTQFIVKIPLTHKDKD